MVFDFFLIAYFFQARSHARGSWGRRQICIVIAFPKNLTRIIFNSYYVTIGIVKSAAVLPQISSLAVPQQKFPNPLPLPEKEIVAGYVPAFFCTDTVGKLKNRSNGIWTLTVVWKEKL